jgi:hypothetical protein
MATRIPTRIASIVAVVLFAVVGATTACGSDPTGPGGGGPIDTTPRIEVTSTQLAQSQLVVDDVTIRLIPSVANFPGTLELSAAMGALAQVVAARDAQGVIENVARGRTALAQVRAQTTIAEAADLDAIELALRDAELLITFPSS